MKGSCCWHGLQDSVEGGSKEEVAELLTQLLLKKAGWLAQHFSIDIDAGMCALGSFLLALLLCAGCFLS